MPPCRVSPLVLAACIGGFLVLRAALFAITTAGEYALYLDYATQARASSLAQLHHERDIEYPPLATLFGVVVLHVADCLPDETELLTALRPNPTRGPAAARYEVALGLVLFAVDVASLVLISRLSRRLYPEDDPWTRLGRLGLYVAATTAIGLILYDRQDLIVGFVGLLTVAVFLRGWSILAYTILAAGVAYKLVPILLIPLVVLAFAALRSAPASTSCFLRAVTREAIFAGAVLALVPVLIYLFCGGERAFVFLKFHSSRGLQLEASAAWLAFLLDPATQVGHGFGSYTLRGELADRIARLTTPFTIGASLLAILITARGFWRAADQEQARSRLAIHLAAGSLLVWLGFILCTKVGSPQYLLWLAPLAPLLPLRGATRRWAALLLAAMVVTTLIFPCLYAEVRGPRVGEEWLWAGPTTLGLVLLAAKSILLAVAFVWLALLVWRAEWLGDASGRS